MYTIGIKEGAGHKAGPFLVSLAAPMGNEPAERNWLG